MSVILTRIYRLTLIAVSGPKAWRGYCIYAIVLGFQFAGVWVSVRLIAWSKAFFDALENRDSDAALVELGNFGVLIAASVSFFLIGDWLRKRLFLCWRQRLTEHVEGAWLANKAYWRLRPGFTNTPVDNPDQRIAEDCRLFVNRLLIETLDLISNIVALGSYITVLWSISSFPLTFTAFDYDVYIPRYMVWTAFVYVAIASVITHVLGRPIKNLVFAQERREANFRHALIQLREGADEVAQSSGEEAERKRLARRFGEIRANWFRLINAELILGFFVRPYFSTVLRIPTFLALPAFFAGSLTLGGLMQLASAFSRVTTTLSWFIFSYRDLAEFAAVSERLDLLLKAAKAPEPIPGVARNITRRKSSDDALRVKGLALTTPQGKKLTPVPDFALAKGQRLWVKGRSGGGKSTFLAAVSGLWPYGEGEIETPAGQLLALPQSPRVFPEGLSHAAVYPCAPEEVGRAAIEEALRAVGLEHRIGALDLAGSEGFAGLSIGERQRLALARVLIIRPQILVLDEATSALDAAGEEGLLGLLRRELPQASIICAAHRPPTPLAPFTTLSLDPASQAGGANEFSLKEAGAYL